MCSHFPTPVRTVSLTSVTLVFCYRVLEGATDMATTLIGTPYYMSPELFSNKPYNHKVSVVCVYGCTCAFVCVCVCVCVCMHACMCAHGPFLRIFTSGVTPGPKAKSEVGHGIDLGSFLTADHEIKREVLKKEYIKKMAIQPRCHSHNPTMTKLIMTGLKTVLRQFCAEPHFLVL